MYTYCRAEKKLCTTNGKSYGEKIKTMFMSQNALKYARVVGGGKIGTTCSK
jgi:hypothetical protein